MGCIVTKKKLFLEGVPSYEIKPVYRAHELGVTLTDIGSPQKGIDIKEVTCEVRIENARNLAEHVQLERMINKNGKYKARCDSRITAKYDIKALIYKGTFSRVVRVEHKITKQPYAIKIIDCKEGRDNCESELSILKRVRHPNVIRLIEVFETADKVYMVMGLATGGDLIDRIVSRGVFTERDAVRVLNMVLDGVKYLHSLGITHRDLKPENLLYYHPANDSKLMITGFGLACTRKYTRDIYMYTSCGTPEYIAPEVVAKKPYTCAVDMWALGVMTYLLLSGTFPFETDNPGRLYKQILKAKFSFPPQSWSDISGAAQDFISHLLLTDVSDRMTAEDALEHPWIISVAADASQKNLQRSVSHNLTKTSRSSSHGSSDRSGRSLDTTRSLKSLLTEHQRIQP